MLMVKTRYSSKFGSGYCGIGQGCVLSMFLFTSALDPILAEITEQFNGNACAYADDLLIGISRTDNEEEVKRIIAEKYKTIGLEINM